MSKAHIALPITLSILALSRVAIAAPYTFAPTFSGVVGINDVGQISGSNGRGVVENIATGIVTPLPAPALNGFTSYGNGINNAGLVSGYYTTSGASTGYVINPATGAYTLLPSEGGFPIGAFFQGINDAGQVVGYAYPGYHTSYADPSFLYNPVTGTSTTFVDPATGTASGYMTTGQVGYTEAFDINNRGQIVGSTSTPTPTSGGVYQPTGFLRDLATDTYTTISVPGADATYAYGLNDVGQIVGSYIVGGSFNGLYYSGGTTNGFILDLGTGQYTTLDDPAAGAVSTNLLGINNAGQIVGTYSDADGYRFGFIATPAAATAVPEPSPAPLVAVALTALALTRRRKAA